MRRSFVGLVLSSVLLFWAIEIVVIGAYAFSQSWTEAKARTDGVFFVYNRLDEQPAENRAARLAELRPHFRVNFALLPLDEVERRVGRPLHPGEQMGHRVSWRQAWYFLAFTDGQSALAAGPVNPTVPTGVVPVGVLLALLGLPLIGGLLALRVERRLTKVERANEALAAGELSARVDITSEPSDELAASFNAMAERVEALVRSRDELVQAISHELGSPLSRLRFHLELQANQPEEKRTERFEAMTRELDALEQLVAELLGYAQSDHLDLDRRAFDPHRVLGDLAELACLEAPEDRAVEVDLEVPQGAIIFADQRLFQRAIENLLRNAVQHAHSQVRLELGQDEAFVRVAVHDDGPGIPEELHEKVTVPFFRLQADRNRRTGGVGLGLAIVRRIMQRHGGHLAIANSPLGGAVVSTVWPKGGCP